MVELSASTEQPADLQGFLHEIARAPAEAFDLNRTLVRLLDYAAKVSGARSVYLKRAGGEPGRGIVACSQEGGGITLEGTVESQNIAVIDEGIQVATIVLLHDGPATSVGPEQLRQLESLADLAAEALRRAGADDEIRRNQIALREALGAKYKLVGGVSLNLKNSLTVAAGYMQLLEMQADLPPGWHEYVERGSHAIDSAVMLINELVDLARSEAGDITIELENLNLVTFVRDAIANHTRAAAAKRILLHADTPPRTPTAYTDPTHVRTILDALLSNAVKYTPENGVISVHIDHREGRRMSDPASWICVSVHDTGTGMAEPEMLFEETRRVEKEQQGRQVGFRLVICRRIARLLGGDLTVESTLGRGTSFTLWLPLPRSRP